MVNQSMVMAEKLVHADTDTLTIPNFHTGEFEGFASPDELEEFLRTFQEGGEDEAQVDTQGEADVGGEPTNTVH